MAFVAKSAYQLEQYGLAGTACISQRQLALFVVPDCGGLELIRRAVELALGNLEPERDFTLHCGSNILVETSKRKRHVICDGEVRRLTAPFRFRILKDALRVLVPLFRPQLPQMFNCSKTRLVNYDVKRRTRPCHIGCCVCHYPDPRIGAVRC